MCIEQPHKLSTPIIPVRDYKRLHDKIVGGPHEGESFPVSANMLLLVWRSFPYNLSELLLVDMRKACMTIMVKPGETCFQGIKMPWKNDSQNYGICVADLVNSAMKRNY